MDDFGIDYTDFRYFKGRFKKEVIEKNAKNCFSFSELCRMLGISANGSNITRIHKKLDELGIDYSHFTNKGWNVYGHEKFGNSGKPIDEYFCENGSNNSSSVKQRLFNNHLKENRCEKCGITEWMGKPLTMQLHHINGIHNDNRLENLQILCPNCHSQTDTYCKQFINRNMN